MTNSLIMKTLLCSHLLIQLSVDSVHPFIPHPLIHLSVHTFISPSILHLSVHPSSLHFPFLVILPVIHSWSSILIHLSVHLFIPPFSIPSSHPFVCSSIIPLLSIPSHPSSHPFVCSSIHPSILHS